MDHSGLQLKTELKSPFENHTDDIQWVSFENQIKSLASGPFGSKTNPQKDRFQVFLVFGCRYSEA